jgi:hypothetical protein
MYQNHTTADTDFNQGPDLAGTGFAFILTKGILPPSLPRSLSFKQSASLLV